MTPAAPSCEQTGTADGTQQTGAQLQKDQNRTTSARTCWRAAHPNLRQATQDDYAFGERMYVATMQPLLERLNAWDENDLLARFKDAFRPEEAWIIHIDGTNAGWLQVTESDEALTLRQLHLAPEVRGRGIGTGLIRQLTAEAEGKGKRVLLSVVRNNRAFSLYRRLGFKVVGEGATRLHMAWTPPPRERQRRRKPRSDGA